MIKEDVDLFFDDCSIQLCIDLHSWKNLLSSSITQVIVDIPQHLIVGAKCCLIKSKLCIQFTSELWIESMITSIRIIRIRQYGARHVTAGWAADWGSDCG